MRGGLPTQSQPSAKKTDRTTECPLWLEPGSDFAFDSDILWLFVLQKKSLNPEQTAEAQRLQEKHE